MRASVIADMSIFGHCPAYDDFYLVVCNHCSQVVKPQAFQKHCGEGARGPSRGRGGWKGTPRQGQLGGLSVREGGLGDREVLGVAA